VIAYWSELLGIDKEHCGMDDSFFDIGGDSLKVLFGLHMFYVLCSYSFIVCRQCNLLPMYAIPGANEWILTVFLSRRQ
jgi:hypothetical protein